jgi:hypothetical protein
LLERLEEDRVVVVSGPAGDGKSVLGKHAVEILPSDYFAFAFRANEFAASHLDETSHRAQVGVGAERLLALLAGQGRYREPLGVKSNPEIRSAVLMILDQLVDSGSSAAYRMRDDFVTPIAQQDA